MVHRISGVLLALFLPFHFYLLGLALNDVESFDNALQWTDQPIVKFAEFGLVFLLALHLFGGLRLLTLEFLPWTDSQKTVAAAAAGLAMLVAVLFLMQAL